MKVSRGSSSVVFFSQNEHKNPVCNFIQNWSTNGSHCARVFPPFARLLPGRHVYGLCTALTKFHEESHSSSSPFPFLDLAILAALSLLDVVHT